MAVARRWAHKKKDPVGEEVDDGTMKQAGVQYETQTYSRRSQVKNPDLKGQAGQIARAVLSEKKLAELIAGARLGEDEDVGGADLKRVKVKRF